ncbi:MliC family protein [Conservatibacter flavescens]|uniref:Uncharacterized protein n=1 Tax=Conservatibacter flavescens TaxID=28161 RepID=A0A2M8S1L2_9PAST|nr:MliC family protein [Conservatibacter flavescens]PJG85004.1 hypothetical protein CVP05_08220 [Conservatibacter flavescens]
MLIKTWIPLLSLVVTGCSQFVLPQIDTPQNQTVLPSDNAIQQKSKAIRYQCKDNKSISLVYITKSSKNKQKNQQPINLTFKNTTQRLVPIVTETGQKYTNIHWSWTNLGEYATLTTAVGVLLAEQCVKQ